MSEHYAVVEAVASTIAAGGKMPPGVEYEDLLSWGVEGLVKANRNFDKDKGTQFRTYANFRVRGEILDNIRKEWSQRSQSAYKNFQEKIQERIAEVVEGSIETESGGTVDESKKKVSDLLSNSAIVYLLSLDDMSVSSMAERVEDSSTNIEETYEVRDDSSVIWNATTELEPLEQTLIKLFYKEERNQKEIADILKLSRSKVCRLHSKALEKLRRRVFRQYEE
ncbi:MAG: sigma-70 family RNA polymerase sigma factor [bacterium]|nr:sigma-70 family RNA polymerase sigma factor [bacterium]